MKYYQQNNNYIRIKKNEARNDVDAIEESIKRMGESRQKREQKYGKYVNLIIKGEQDRINGNSPQVFEDESMSLSYSYGYYEKGSRVLEGKFSKGNFTKEEQRDFGILDVINNVPNIYVNNLTKYPSYDEGRIYQLGKNTYDFTLENELDFDEYVSILMILQPELKSLAFEDGYRARKLELANRKSKKL